MYTSTLENDEEIARCFKEVFDKDSALMCLFFSLECEKVAVPLNEGYNRTDMYGVFGPAAVVLRA
jgi:hypothetical protein